MKAKKEKKQLMQRELSFTVSSYSGSLHSSTSYSSFDEEELKLFGPSSKSNSLQNSPQHIRSRQSSKENL